MLRIRCCRLDDVAVVVVCRCGSDELVVVVVTARIEEVGPFCLRQTSCWNLLCQHNSSRTPYLYLICVKMHSHFFLLYEIPERQSKFHSRKDR